VLGIAVGALVILAVGQPPQDAEHALREMVARIDESEIHRTTYDLQNFTTRQYPSAGNGRAAEYLRDRLDAIPGLEVNYQGDEYRNVIATLPGADPASEAIVIVGAHYDSVSDDPERAPGATDNAAGAAIVLELARVMSTYRFNHTVQFSFWNAEEDKLKGSRDFAAHAAAYDLEIPLYVNFDSACYDPDGEYVLDVMYDDRSAPFSKLYTQYNEQYGIGLNLTFNVHECGSDHTSFRKEGYPAITTHSQEHAPADHTPGDTIDLVSPAYAAKNARLGALVVADTAGLRA
jgi:Zn-dependent M28 family amino/carboxypeptidase